jgi:PAS domain S-box-containing protein
MTAKYAAGEPSQRANNTAAYPSHHDIEGRSLGWLHEWDMGHAMGRIDGRNHGLYFTATLNYLRAAGERGALRDNDGNRGSATVERKESVNVLVVEDQPAHAEIISRAFVRSGLTVDVVANLAEARQRIAADAPDLVIADLMLPDGRGTELLGSNTRVPIVIMTSHGDETAAVDAMRNGALDYVVKSDEAFRELPHLARRTLREWRHIVERGRAEAALRERQARFESLVRNIPGAVYRYTGAGIEFLSDAIETITGLPATRFLGDGALNLLAVVHPDDRQQVVDSRASALVRYEPFALEYRLIHDDGSIRWVSDKGLGHFDEATRAAWVDGIIFDVSERIRAREVETRLQESQKLDSIGRLAAGVAHDFNNLLTVILANCGSLLKRSDVVPAARLQIEDIHAAAHRSASLTRQLLTFSRHQPLSPELIDVNRVIEEMLRLLHRILGEDVRVEMRLGQALHPVRADHAKLEQVLVNLAVNARDAMPGGGTITFATRNEVVDGAAARQMNGLAPGEHVVVSVIDTGEGMAPEVVAHLFEPFYTTKPRGRGTGLGLATAHGIVAQSGGHIAVESHPGRGSRFDIYLPRYHEVQAAALPIATGSPTTTHSSATILVVEDEASLLIAIRRILEPIGHTVLTALDAAEASRLLAETGVQADLIVSDIVLRDERGPAMVERLRAAGYRGRVLFISGYADRERIEGGLVRGRDPFLAKPFTATELIDRVREVLASPDESSGAGSRTR